MTDLLFSKGWGVDDATSGSVFTEGWWPGVAPDPSLLKIVMDTRTGAIVWRPSTHSLAATSSMEVLPPPPASESLTIDLPVGAMAGQLIQLAGTYSNVKPVAIDVSLDGGATWVALTSLVVIGGGWAGLGPAPSAAGQLVATVRDHAAPSVTATTDPFSVAPATVTPPPPVTDETLTVVGPASAPISSPIPLSGTYANVTLTGVEYSVDGGATWTAAAGFSTGSTETITINTPASATVGTPLVLSGTFDHAIPTAFDYSIDGGVTWLPIASLSETASTWTGVGPTFTAGAPSITPPSAPPPSQATSGSWQASGPTPGSAERLVIMVRDVANQAVVASTASISVGAAPRMGPLAVSPDNPRYFAAPAGPPIYLCGSHTRNSLADIALSGTAAVVAFDFTAYVAMLQSDGMNLIRLWSAENPTLFSNHSETESPVYYLRTGPGTDFTGKTKFDLTQFNQAYFDRLRARCIQAGNVGMYVSVMLFDGWAQMAKNGAATDPYESHPYNPANNIGGVSAGSGYAIGTLSLPAITALQEAYVRKVVDTVSDLDNVLFEVMNEPENDASQRAFVWHWPAFIRAYETTKGNSHPIIVSSPLPGEGDPSFAAATMTGSGADAIAPGNTLGMAPAIGSQVVIGDTAHSATGLDANFVWQQFTLGYNVWYLDGLTSLASQIAGALDGDSIANAAAADSARIGMKGTRIAVGLIDLAQLIPDPSASSTGYALYASGLGAVVYAPAGGTFTVDLSSNAGPVPTLVAGIGTAYPTIAAALAAAPNGVIALTDGTYAPADIPAAAGNITLMAVNRRKVVIDGKGGHGAGFSLANDKGGIHVSPPASGRRTVNIRGISFINCGGADRTGDGEAGLYFEDAIDGTVFDCQFDGNENGIFTRNPSSSVIVNQDSEFGKVTSNGQSRDGLSHDIYAACASYTEINCFHYGNLWGHSFKSRSNAAVVHGGLYTYGQSRAFDIPNGGTFSCDGAYISGVVGVGNCYGYADENTLAGVSNQTLTNVTLVTIGPRLAFYAPNGGVTQFTNVNQIWVSDSSGQPSITVTGTGTVTGLALTPSGNVLTTIPPFPTFVPSSTSGGASLSQNFDATWISAADGTISSGGKVQGGSATASFTSPFGSKPSALVLVPSAITPSVTVTTPSGISALSPVHLSGSFVVATPTAMDYSTDGGSTWFPISSFVTNGSSWSGIGPTYPAAAASVQIMVRDHNATTVQASSAPFAVSAPLSETITVITPTNAVVNSPVPLSGTYANGTPRQFDYLFNGTWTTIPLAGTVIGNGVWSAPGPIFASVKASVQLSVRDHNDQSVVAQTGTFSINLTVTELLTATAPASVLVNTAVPLSGTYANAAPTAFDYSVDGGTTWLSVAAASIGGGMWSGTGPTYSSLSSGNLIKVRDHSATTVITSTGPISVVSSITESIGVNTPANVLTGSPVTLSGTYLNATPTAFDYSLDGGVTWVALANVSVSAGSWSGTGPTYAAPATAQTIVVRDHNATTITHATGTFDVSAPPVETITVNTPTNVFAGTSVSLSGSYANGTPTAFDYSVDGGVTWQAITNLVESSGNWSGTGPTF